MAGDEVIINYPGSNYVMIEGQCYEFIEFMEDETPEGLVVDGTFDSCEECETPPDSSSSSSSSVFISFPPSCAGCGSTGDVHWVWGQDLVTNGPDMASFNVDDNSSLNEIVWFTFLEGVTEYSISYTQQEFNFTAGGKSIDQITISETGQPDIVYTLTPSQNGVLKNGLAFVEPDTFTFGTNVCDITITSRTIDDSTNCCMVTGEFFSLFNMTVQFNDGLYNTDEVGGALYYIWKTAKDEVGLSNHLSMEGIDGIGDYLATGSTGYTARAEFEVAPAAVREATDSVTLGEIATRMAELNGLNGTVNFDWDPLVDDSVDCGTDTCPNPAPVTTYPTMLMRLEWTDGDTTKNWLGCDWCNGETKEVYASHYGYFTASTSAGEFWQREKVGGPGGFLDAFWMEAYYVYTTGVTPEGLVINLPYAGTLGSCRDEVSTITPSSYYQNASCLGILNLGDMPVSSGGFLLGKQKNNSYTDANNITYTWTEGSGW
jgi:hypothetical protein